MKSLIFLLLSVIVLLGCSSERYFRYKTEEEIGPQEYNFIAYQDPISFEILEYYPSDFECGTEGGTPFGLFVGKTKIKDSKLSDTISFLARCEDRVFKIGQVLVARQIPQSKNLPPLKTFYSTIAKRHKTTRLLGAEYPAFWCEVEIFEN